MDINHNIIYVTILKENMPTTIQDLGEVQLYICFAYGDVKLGCAIESATIKLTILTERKTVKNCNG